MNGVILDEMREFVAGRYGYRAWVETLRRAGRSLTHRYSLDGVYPDGELPLLAMSAAEVTQTPPAELLERFGEAIVPDMMRMYSFLVDPAWTYPEFLLNMERLLNRAIEIHAPGAEQSRVTAARLEPDAVRVVYASPLRACAAVRGVMLGAAKEYRVGAEIIEEKCVLRGDPECVFRVRWQPKSRPSPNS